MRFALAVHQMLVLSAWRPPFQGGLQAGFDEAFAHPSYRRETHIERLADSFVAQGRGLTVFVRLEQDARMCQCPSRGFASRQQIA